MRAASYPVGPGPAPALSCAPTYSPPVAAAKGHGPRFDVQVPEFGTVYWTPKQIDAYAREAGRTHQPDMTPREWCLRPPFRRRRHAICVYCSGMWPCRTVEWSRWWLNIGAGQAGLAHTSRHTENRAHPRRLFMAVVAVAATMVAGCATALVGWL